MIRKEIKKYYFSVEGETEKWYLKWLEDKINEIEKSSYKVKFDTKVQKNPKKRAKQLSVIGKLNIFHMMDFEELNNEKSFQDTLTKMKEAEKIKSIKYILGYSNYIFDLWIILHKKLLNSSQNYRDNYLHHINQCYQEKFESMADYKREANFKRVLTKLDFNDVVKAIGYAEKIMNDKTVQGYTEIRYKAYKYYRNNPSLSIHIVIKSILLEVGIIS